MLMGYMLIMLFQVNANSQTGNGNPALSSVNVEKIYPTIETCQSAGEDGIRNFVQNAKAHTVAISYTCIPSNSL